MKISPVGLFLNAISNKLFALLPIENLDSKSSSGSRIELPGGGYIELPNCQIDPRELNNQPRCHSDIFQGNAIPLYHSHD